MLDLDLWHFTPELTPEPPRGAALFNGHESAIPPLIRVALLVRLGEEARLIRTWLGREIQIICAQGPGAVALLTHHHAYIAVCM